MKVEPHSAEQVCCVCQCTHRSVYDNMFNPLYT